MIRKIVVQRSFMPLGEVSTLKLVKFIRFVMLLATYHMPLGGVLAPHYMPLGGVSAPYQ